jgi:hypothetical protein
MTWVNLEDTVLSEQDSHKRQTVHGGVHSSHTHRNRAEDGGTAAERSRKESCSMGTELSASLEICFTM